MKISTEPRELKYLRFRRKYIENAVPTSKYYKESTNGYDLPLDKLSPSSDLSPQEKPGQKSSL